MYAQWKEEYSVGVARFDKSHKELYSMINELHDGIVEGKFKDTPKKALKSLVNYLIKHFADEERLMKKHGYPEFASHKLEHDEFRNWLQSFFNDCAQGSASLSIDILNHIVEWLENHVTKSDKKYQPYLSALQEKKEADATHSG